MQGEELLHPTNRFKPAQVDAGPSETGWGSEDGHDEALPERGQTKGKTRANGAKLTPQGCLWEEKKR